MELPPEVLYGLLMTFPGCFYFTSDSFSRLGVTVKTDHLLSSLSDPLPGFSP